MIQRANRKLKTDADWQQVKKCSRHSRAYDTLGDYYVLDVRRNFVIDKNIDLEDFARNEWGVLAEWEEMVDEEAN